MPIWFPRKIASEHYQRLFVEPSLQWLFTSVFMSLSSMALVCMVASYSTNYGLLIAGATLGSVPIVLIFIFFQNTFTQGIALGAVKG